MKYIVIILTALLPLFSNAQFCGPGIPSGNTVVMGDVLDNLPQNTWVQLSPATEAAYNNEYTIGNGLDVHGKIVEFQLCDQPNIPLGSPAYTPIQKVELYSKFFQYLIGGEVGCDALGFSTVFYILDTTQFPLKIAHWKDDGISCVPSTDESYVMVKCDNCEDPVLPVTWGDVWSEESGSSNIVHWTVHSQTNNRLFALYSSEDGFMFQLVDTIQGAGTTTEYMQYSLEDKSPHRRTYYKVKQIDFDGKSEYSKTISQNNNSILQSVDVYPNPFENSLRLAFSSDSDKRVVVTVNDQIGRIILNQSLEISSGEQTISLNLFSAPSGIYNLTIQDGQTITNYRIIKQ